MSDSRAVVVTKRLRRDIISGELTPGSRLTEALLSQSYGVSRMPIRESLRSLAAEGLVEIRPYAGATVATPPDDDAADLFAIRVELEAATARRAAESVQAQRTQDQPHQRWWSVRRGLEDVLIQGDAAVASGELRDLAGLNVRFHQGVAELSGSATLSALLDQISGRIEWLFTTKITKRGSEAWAEHREIISAVDAGDPALAAELMRRHVERSKATFLAQLDL